MPKLDTGRACHRSAPRMIFSAMFLSLLMHSEAIACIIMEPFDINEIRKADLIVVGKLNRYEVVRHEDQYGHSGEYGLITASVTKSIKGRALDDLQLFWQNSTFGYPSELVVSDSVLIAIRAAPEEKLKRLDLASRISDGMIFVHEPPTLPHILQSPCSGPFILPFSAKLETTVRAILEGASIKDAEELVYGTNLAMHDVPAVYRSERNVRINPMIGLGLLFLIALALPMIWAMRRKRP